MRTKLLLAVLLVLANLPTLLYAQTVDIRGYSKGQKTMANSFPMVIASDQSALPVTGTFWPATQPVSMVTNTPVGSVAHDGAAAGVNPLLVGCYASAAAPTNVSADTDAVRMWCLRNGSQVMNIASGGTLLTIGQKTMANALSFSLASDYIAPVAGTVAHDAVDSGNPVKVGCQARTTTRAAVADADRVDCMADKNGRLVTTLSPRERVVRSGVITLTTTTETTLIAAGGAGVFRDLTYLKCTNNSATLVRLDLRDATAGTVIDSWALAASGGGFNLAFSVPYNQATANSNWTVQLSASVTDVRCSAQAMENN